MVRVMSMWGRLDRVETAKNAESILMDYHHRKQLAKSWSMWLQSPEMNGMPKAEAFENSAESKILSHISDDEFVKRCEEVVEGIEDPALRDLIKWTYFQPLDSVTLIAERLNLSRASYYRDKETALIAFAELWPPFPSRLVVYK